MKRRDFMVGFAAAASLPRAVRAQQPAVPVIGFLSNASAEAYEIRLRAFRQGLAETGFVEGRNLEIDYRWANNDNDRLASLAADLVGRKVAVLISAGGTPSALAAKAATSTIPIVFAMAANPVAIGLVSRLNQPGGNATGVTNQNVEIGPKRLEVLRELLPKAMTVAVLVNPTSPGAGDMYLQDIIPAARAMGFRLERPEVRNDDDLETVFASLAQLRTDAVLVSPDVFFNTRSEQIAALSLRHKIPSIYQYRKFAAAGGLVSYGSDETESYRLVGIYAGKILKGEKPGDLPVQQAIKVELIINLKTAKTLGVTVPLSLLGRADEIIE
jgi:putative ABC transport system substrate-binding protein